MSGLARMLMARECLCTGSDQTSSPVTEGLVADGIDVHAGPAPTQLPTGTELVVASAAIALSIDDLGIVLSFVGATGSTIVSYILPGACYYSLCRDAGPKRFLGLLQLVLGLILMPLSLTLIILKMHGKS